MEHFKTLEDLREYIKRFDKYYARPIVKGEHPTLYLNPGSSKKEVICGIQRDDYIFSTDGRWVLPSEEYGLSFSGHWQHLKGIYRMKSKNNSGKAVSVFWVLEGVGLPEGLKIVVDPRDRKKQHYLLCATRRMRASELRNKLQCVADRMSVIKGAQVAL